MLLASKTCLLKDTKKFFLALFAYQNGVQIAVQMCQKYKWNGVSPTLSWWLFHYKYSQNKNGLTPLYLATFYTEFYAYQNSAVM